MGRGCVLFFPHVFFFMSFKFFIPTLPTLVSQLSNRSLKFRQSPEVFRHTGGSGMLFNTTKSYHCWREKRKRKASFSSPCWFFFSLNSCTAVLSTPPPSVLLVFRFVQMIESVRAVCCTTKSRQEPLLYFMWLLLPGVVHHGGPGFRDALVKTPLSIDVFIYDEKLRTFYQEKPIYYRFVI